VTVDGRTATIGMSVDPALQVVRLDGARVKAAVAPVYIAAYKPVGVLTSSASQGGKPTILDIVQVPERVFPVGRLDVDSEGLLLLTNDGDLAMALTHPRFGHEKEYRVLLDARPTGEQLDRWRSGVRLSDGTRALAASVLLETKGAWVHVVMRQGPPIRDTAAAPAGTQAGRTRIASLRVGAATGRGTLKATSSCTEAGNMAGGRSPARRSNHGGWRK
jgi:23S rRNA pseudouridine2605 synthase